LEAEQKRGFSLQSTFWIHGEFQVINLGKKIHLWDEVYSEKLNREGLILYILRVTLSESLEHKNSGIKGLAMICGNTSNYQMLCPCLGQPLAVGQPKPSYPQSQQFHLGQQEFLPELQQQAYQAPPQQQAYQPQQQQQQLYQPQQQQVFQSPQQAYQSQQVYQPQQQQFYGQQQQLNQFQQPQLSNLKQLKYVKRTCLT
jgi:hypothetical protein